MKLPAPHRLRRAGALALLAAMLLGGLGTPRGARHPDESIYLTIALEMVERGDVWTPSVEGDPTFYKPPLLHWLQRLAFAAFGLNLFAARLPVGLCAIALALWTGRLARRVHGPAAELPAVLLAGTALATVRFGRLAMMDVPFALALVAVADGAFTAVEANRPRALVACGIGAGAAVLLKGPVGALLAALLAGGLLALSRPRLLLSRWTATSLVAGLVLAGPWFAAMSVRHGDLFFARFFVEEHGAKFTPPWSILGELGLLASLPGLLLPWSFLFLGALHRLRPIADPRNLLPVVWIAAVLAVFSIPPVKHPHYLLPCLPAAILIAGRPDPSRWARAATAAVLGLVAAGILLALRWPVAATAAAAATVSSGLLVAAAALVARARVAAAAALAGAASGLLVAVVIPAFDRPPLPPAVLDAAGGRTLRVYGEYPGFAWLAGGRRVHAAWGEAWLGGALAGGEAVAMPEKERDHLSPSLRDGLAVLARWSRVRTALSPEEVWRSWRAADRALLEESMVLVARSSRPGDGAPGRPFPAP